MTFTSMYSVQCTAAAESDGGAEAGEMSIPSPGLVPLSLAGATTTAMGAGLAGSGTACAFSGAAPWGGSPATCKKNKGERRRVNQGEREHVHVHAHVHVVHVTCAWYMGCPCTCTCPCNMRMVHGVCMDTYMGMDMGMGMYV